jgi:DNA excision repair protein ERCC-4
VVNRSIENVLILVDDRERPSGVAEELGKLSGVLVRIERLAVGDYNIDGSVLIERKTATDFAQSLIDGRLFSQAKQMADSPLRTAYILEGSSAEWLGLGVSREAMKGRPRGSGQKFSPQLCCGRGDRDSDGVSVLPTGLRFRNTRAK